MKVKTEGKEGIHVYLKGISVSQFHESKVPFPADLSWHLQILQGQGLRCGKRVAAPSSRGPA